MSWTWFWPIIRHSEDSAMVVGTWNNPPKFEVMFMRGIFRRGLKSGPTYLGYLGTKKHMVASVYSLLIGFEGERRQV